MNNFETPRKFKKTELQCLTRNQLKQLKKLCVRLQESTMDQLISKVSEGDTEWVEYLERVMNVALHDENLIDEVLQGTPLSLFESGTVQDYCLN